MPVKVFPRAEALRRLLRPAETQLYSGDELARTKGEGIEFADLRPFAFGDRVRRINWRASARRGELWVNEQHPERNVDVVLFLDSFAEVRRGLARARSTSPCAPRRRSPTGTRGAATASASSPSAATSAGWQPGGGLAQLYRIVDALLDTEITLSHAWKAIDIVPARTLPPQALVVALTPLLDERSVARAAAPARARLRPRRDRAVAARVRRPGRRASRSSSPTGSGGCSARRCASQFHAAGVPVVEWRDGDPLAAPIEEVTAFRRHATLARA